MNVKIMKFINTVSFVSLIFLTKLVLAEVQETTSNKIQDTLDRNYRATHMLAPLGYQYKCISASDQGDYAQISYGAHVDTFIDSMVNCSRKIDMRYCAEAVDCYLISDTQYLEEHENPQKAKVQKIASNIEPEKLQEPLYRATHMLAPTGYEYKCVSVSTFPELVQIDYGSSINTFKDNLENCKRIIDLRYCAASIKCHLITSTQREKETSKHQTFDEIQKEFYPDGKFYRD